MQVETIPEVQGQSLLTESFLEKQQCYTDFIDSNFSFRKVNAKSMKVPKDLSTLLSSLLTNHKNWDHGVKFSKFDDALLKTFQKGSLVAE